MIANGQSCNSSQLDVTSCSTSPSSTTKGKAPRERSAEDKILASLRASEIEISNKIIALRTGLPVGTVNPTLQRMKRKQMVVRGETGWKVPELSRDAILNKELMFDGTKASLPKVHDLHLTFKRENIRKAIRDRSEASTLFRDVHYSLEDAPQEASEQGKGADRGPVREIYAKADIGSYKKIPSLSRPPTPDFAGSEFIEQFFNPFNPDGLYQRWTAGAHKLKELKGGVQETFDFASYKIKFQLYGTGTVKIIFANSEAPFGAPEFRAALQRLDGIFSARTGVRFLDIQSLFFIERCHFNNDISGQHEIAGAGRLCCTVQQFEDWLYRSYEKILGDELVVREEACLEHGNYEDHNLNAFLALMQGGTNPLLINAQMFKSSRTQQDLQQDLHTVIRTLTAHNKQIDGLIAAQAKTSERTRDNENALTKVADAIGQIAELLVSRSSTAAPPAQAPLPPPEPESKPLPKPPSPFVSALDIHHSTSDSGQKMVRPWDPAQVNKRRKNKKGKKAGKGAIALRASPGRRAGVGDDTWNNVRC